MSRTGRSVTASVAAGFGSCLVAVGLLLAWATDGAFDDGQARAEEALAATAHSQARELGTLMDSAEPLITDLALDPGLSSFDPVSCARSLAPLASVSEQARIVLVDGAGSTVCSLPEGADAAGLPADVLAAALEGELAVSHEVVVDPVSGEPAVSLAAPVLGPDGGVGAVAAVLFTSRPALELAPGSNEKTVVVAVDSRSGVVAATTPQAPYAAGDQVTWTAPPEIGPDGVRRIWRRLVEPTTGWTVVAGLDVEVAFADARAERRSLLQMGAAILGLVVVLAVTLQRRLALPIRRLGGAIAASRAGDREVRAPEAGPNEIVEVAHAFNELVDEHQELTQRLRDMARHDALTGLLNRRGATEELTRLIDDPTAGPLVVLFIDLDRFKLVNDSHGHAVGDQLLTTLARRLERAVPSEWIVTRFGGDEFVIICPCTPDPLPWVIELGDVLRSTISVGAHELRVGGSTGIAVARPGQTADDIIREADTAMYRAKDRGIGGYAVFDDEMRAWTIARLTTERDLRDAIDSGQLVLHYQPVVDLERSETLGVEALVRWLHPTQGLLAPVSFIPIAEETGLILEIGEWVVREAARAAASWRAAGTPVRVAVNVAAAQLLRGDLVTIVLDALAEAGARPEDLAIEVTESAVLADIESTVTQLAAVRAAGIHVALDDFGTGYSSLAYLQRLPADELKIDRSFVSCIADDRVSAAIVASVVDLAHAVGLDVVAEGVETAEQLDLLGRLGCDRAQGYYLGRPAPAADLAVGRRWRASLSVTSVA